MLEDKLEVSKKKKEVTNKRGVGRNFPEETVSNVALVRDHETVQMRGVGPTMGKWGEKRNQKRIN